MMITWSNINRFSRFVLIGKSIFNKLINRDFMHLKSFAKLHYGTAIVKKLVAHALIEPPCTHAHWIHEILHKHCPRAVLSLVQGLIFNGPQLTGSAAATPSSLSLTHTLIGRHISRHFLKGCTNHDVVGVDVIVVSSSRIIGHGQLHTRLIVCITSIVVPHVHCENKVR